MYTEVFFIRIKVWYKYETHKPHQKREVDWLIE
jgi:hypothetical protein